MLRIIQFQSQIVQGTRQNSKKNDFHTSLALKELKLIKKLLNGKWYEGRGVEKIRTEDGHVTGVHISIPYSSGQTQDLLN